MCQNVCYEYNSGDQQVTEHHKMNVASTLTAELELISLHLLIYTCNLHNNKYNYSS